MKKLSDKEKQQVKEYKKMLKKYKKILKKDAKRAADNPFDYGPGMQLLIDHMKFMQEYYKIGYNVWGAEWDGHPTRYDSLTEALKEYDAGWNEDNDLVYQFYPKIPFAESLVSDIFVDKDISKSNYFVPDWQHPLNGLTFEEATEAYRKTIKEHKKKFFDILLEEQEYWGD